MDSKKMGAFIAKKRKEQQMTQKQLGEALGCSDKLISKWECGNGLPDASMMLPLCELLKINVNELLSGESLTQDSYHEKAEENIMNLVLTNENQKRKMIKEVFSGIILVLGFILILIFLSLTVAYPVSIAVYMDGKYIIDLVLILIFSLGYAGRLKDLKNAFVFIFVDAENPKALKNAVTAVALAEKTLLVGGAFDSIFYAIYVLYEAGAAGAAADLQADMAVAMLAFFYGVVGVMLLSPIRGKLEKKL